MSNTINFIVSFSTCLKLRQLLEKDTKLEIENKSSPFVPIVNKEPHNPETPLVQIDSKKEASSKVSFRASFQQIYSLLQALADMCSNYRMPVILIRGMCQALRLDLGFFSTKSLSQVAGDRSLSIFTQTKSERWNLGEKYSLDMSLGHFLSIYHRSREKLHRITAIYY